GRRERLARLAADLGAREDALARAARALARGREQVEERVAHGREPRVRIAEREQGRGRGARRLLWIAGGRDRSGLRGRGRRLGGLRDGGTLVRGGLLGGAARGGSTRGGCARTRGT